MIRNENMNKKKTILYLLIFVFLLFLEKETLAQAVSSEKNCFLLYKESTKLIKNYDSNNDSFISDFEWEKAVSDWEKGKISEEEVLTLLKFSKQKCKIPFADLFIKKISSGNSEFYFEWCYQGDMQLEEEPSIKIIVNGISNFFYPIIAENYKNQCQGEYLSYQQVKMERGKNYLVNIEIDSDDKIDESNEQNNILKNYLNVPLNIPSITLIYPNGKEKWRDGEFQTIRWREENLPPNAFINIYLLRSDGAHKEIASRVSTKKFYFSWKTEISSGWKKMNGSAKTNENPFNFSENNKYEIIISAYWQKSGASYFINVSDKSDLPFTIFSRENTFLFKTMQTQLASISEAVSQLIQKLRFLFGE